MNIEITINKQLYNRNNSGPRIEPWGISESQIKSFEKQFKQMYSLDNLYGKN